MNDFDYDVMMKKKLANSARHKRGNKKGCRLMVDSMTNKEIEAQHGEIKSVNLNQSITYEEYKALPDSLKETYYNNIIDNFNVGPAEIAKMMGVKARSLRAYNDRHGMKLHRTPRNPTNAEKEAFRTAYVKENSQLEKVEPVKRDALDISYLEMDFKNATLEDVFNKLKAMIQGTGDIKIIIRRAENV